MIDTLQIYQDLAQTLDEATARKLATVLGTIYRDLQQTVTKDDFRDLKQTVTDLAQRLDSLAQSVAELTEAQKRTEMRVAELAEAQKRTELRVAELAEAQKRTDLRLDSLTQTVAELAEAQKRTELRLDSLIRHVETGFRDLHNRFGVIGSRWGDGAEETFRMGLLESVRDLGYAVEHYHGEDPEGFINYSPRSYDLDVLVHDGQTVVAEIKSNASGADVTEFHRAVQLFERQTGRQAAKRILIAVTIQEPALERARNLGIIVTTSFAPLENKLRG